MDIKSKQVYAEKIEIIPGTTARDFVMAKGRPGGVIEIVAMGVHSCSNDKIKNVRRVYTVKGETNYLDTKFDLNGQQAKTWFDTIYLADGHEIGVNLKGEKTTNKAYLFVHLLFHSDSEEGK